MNVNGTPFRTIWLKPGNDHVVQVIDQTKLPHAFEVNDLVSVEDVCNAIRDMTVRGAGLIGASAAYGMYLACLHTHATDFQHDLICAGTALKATRPTAANLAWAVHRMLLAIDTGRT
ncbi:MAG TPA: S-methyl-5-thioribose-1-phosphate isomerase, partial [Rhodoferax sp.]|nr:S-methyl-5-thioribose-1-phosphate isomerase [Rhodoferax sp.]